jgi:cytochrome b
LRLARFHLHMAEPLAARVRVWDLPTRLFHWTLTLAVIGLVVTGKTGGNAMIWHLRLGYLVFGLLVFRLLWGFVGGRWSRFRSFVYGPGSLVRYLKGASRDGDAFDIGHSPLGALSVFALLAFLAVQVATGLVSWDDILQIGGPLNRFVSEATAELALGYHKEIGQWIIISLVVLHVGAVLFYLWRRKRNLIAPMWHGDKLLADGTLAANDSRATRVLALLLAGVCGGLVGWVVALGG